MTRLSASQSRSTFTLAELLDGCLATKAAIVWQGALLQRCRYPAIAYG